MLADLRALYLIGYGNSGIGAEMKLYIRPVSDSDLT